MEAYDAMSTRTPAQEWEDSNAGSAAPVDATNPIRLLLVDDKLIVREGVRALLDQQSGFEVVAQANSVAEAIALDVRPDVVITDLVLPDARGSAVIAGLRSRFARATIFVLTEVDQHAQVQQIVGEGVGGYVLKTATAAEFLSGIRSVAQGVAYVQASLRADMGRPSDSAASSRGGESSARDDRTAVSSLTAKEREVLRYLALGHTNAEIATLSDVSLRTVEARRARLLQKLGVRTRADLVRVAHHIATADIDLV